MSEKADLGVIKTDLAQIWASLGPFATCERLNLQYEKLPRQAKICCPWHAEKTASCTVAIGPEGTLRIHCFGCNKTWDVHSLVAQMRGIEINGSGFARVLVAESELLGQWQYIEQIEGRKIEPREPAPIPKRPPPSSETPRKYPDREQVIGLLSQTTMCCDDEQGAKWLSGRSIDPKQVDVRGLAYMLPPDAQLPAWARYRRQNWTSLGYRLIIPLYNESGIVTSVRAGRVTADPDDLDAPKRLPPSGCRLTGLVMANAVAIDLLRTGAWPEWAEQPGIVIAEGEPDFLTSCTHLDTTPTTAVFGIYSGSWTKELAERIPSGSSVWIWSDPDSAGDRYASTVGRSLAARCTIRRGRAQK